MNVPLVIWHVYLVRCRDGSLYCGIAKNVLKRVHRHNTGHGAKYTRSRRPVTLAWSELAGSQRNAMCAERWIKKLSKERKERLIEESQPLNKGVSGWET